MALAKACETALRLITDACIGSPPSKSSTNVDSVVSLVNLLTG